MIEKMTYIELAGGTYPIKCDLAVLEAAQDAYGSLTEFERKLLGLPPETDKKKETKVSREPSMKTVRFILPLMVNEGLDLENAKEGGKRKHITGGDLRELLTDVNMFERADELHREFSRCFVTKNRKSTQGTAEKSA